MRRGTAPVSSSSLVDPAACAAPLVVPTSVVVSIRKLAQAGHTVSAIAHRLAMSPGQVTRICERERITFVAAPCKPKTYFDGPSREVLGLYHGLWRSG